VCSIDARQQQQRKRKQQRQVADSQRNNSAHGRRGPQGNVAPQLVDGPRRGNAQVWRRARHQAICTRVHVHVGGGGHHQLCVVLQRQRRLPGVHAVPRNQSRAFDQSAKRRGQFADTDIRRHRHDGVPNRVVQISMLQINTRLAHHVVVASLVHVYLSVHRGNLTHL